MRLRDELILFYNVIWDTAPCMFQNIIDRSQRRNEVCISIEHFFDAYLILEYAVLYRVNTAANSIENPVSPLCMASTTLMESVTL